MAVDRVPVLKRCRSLDLDPIYLGIDKKSNRESKRANKKISEYGLQLRDLTTLSSVLVSQEQERKQDRSLTTSTFL